MLTNQHHFHNHTLEAKELQQMLNIQINELTLRQKNVYTLNEDGFKINQIASVMKLSKLTIKTHLKAARKEIRKQIREEWEIT